MVWGLLGWLIGDGHVCWWQTPGLGWGSEWGCGRTSRRAGGGDTAPSSVLLPPPSPLALPPRNTSASVDENWYEDDGNTWTASEGFVLKNKNATEPGQESSWGQRWGGAVGPQLLPQPHRSPHRPPPMSPTGGSLRSFTASLERVNTDIPVGASPKTCVPPRAHPPPLIPPGPISPPSPSPFFPTPPDADHQTLTATPVVTQVL